MISTHLLVDNPARAIANRKLVHDGSLADAYHRFNPEAIYEQHITREGRHTKKLRGENVVSNLY